MKKLLICMDYDETYTADTELWDKFIMMSKAHGHTIIFATMRYTNEPILLTKNIDGLVKNIHYTGRIAKLIFLRDIGVEPDIWIDDRPDWLFKDA